MYCTEFRRMFSMSCWKEEPNAFREVIFLFHFSLAYCGLKFPSECKILKQFVGVVENIHIFRYSQSYVIHPNFDMLMFLLSENSTYRIPWFLPLGILENSV